MLSNSDLMDVFDHCKSLGCVVHVHAENGEIVAENEKRLLARGVTGPGDNFFFIFNDINSTLFKFFSRFINQL